MSVTWTGGCQCGGVRYNLDSDAVQTMYVCHCRDCQRQSATAFGISVIVERPGFDIIEGSVKTWVTQGESGNLKAANFCPTCGVRIFHDGGKGSQWISVKGGTLDNTDLLKPQAHLWVKRKQHWLKGNDSLICHDEEPPN